MLLEFTPILLALNAEFIVRLFDALCDAPVFALPDIDALLKLLAILLFELAILLFEAILLVLAPDILALRALTFALNATPDAPAIELLAFTLLAELEPIFAVIWFDALFALFAL